MQKYGTNHARRLRRETTWFEKKLWARLRNRQLIGVKFRRQQPFGICILDFYCAEAKLNIELDGDQHGHPLGIKNGRERDEYLKKNGVRTLRFWNHEIKENLDGVLDTIRLAIENAPPHPNPLPGGGEGTANRANPDQPTGFPCSEIDDEDENDRKDS